MEINIADLPFRISRERVRFIVKTLVEIIPAQMSIMFPLYQAIC